jgi:O-antigen/teichoic acid export membrane protein
MARNTLWLLAGQGTGLCLQAVYFVFVARLLGSTQYGVFVGAFALTSLVAQYSPLGTGTVFLRYVSGRPELCREYLGNILVTTTIMGSLLTGAMCLSARYVLNPASAQLAFLAAIANCLFAQVTIELARVFQAFEKMRITAMLNLLVNAVRTFAAVVLWLAVHHTTAYGWAVVSTVVSGLAAVAAVVLCFVNFGMPKLGFRVGKRHFAEGVGFSFASSTTTVYNDVDKTMLSHYGMNQANGIYSMAYRVVDFATMPVFAIRDAAMPKLFRLGHESIVRSAEYGGTLLRRSFRLTAVVSVGLFFCAGLIPLVVGHGFEESASALRWLAIVPLFRSIHQMTGIVLTSAGKQGTRTIAQCTAAGVNLVLNLYLIPHYGWIGAAWASVLTDGLLALLNWLNLRIAVRRAKLDLAAT